MLENLQEIERTVNNVNSGVIEMSEDDLDTLKNSYKCLSDKYNTKLEDEAFE